MDACILLLAGRPVNEMPGVQPLPATNVLLFADKSSFGAS